MPIMTEVINKTEGFYSVIALPNGQRPGGKAVFSGEGNKKEPLAFTIDIVPKWEPSMPKHKTCGGRVAPQYKSILRAEKGLWLMEFVDQSGVVFVTLTFVNTNTMKEKTLPALEVTGSVESHVISVREGVTEEEMTLLQEVLPGGNLHRPFLVGLNRVYATNPTVFDWGGKG